jgi:U3 small nucleolar RNA-associated protein 13
MLLKGHKRGIWDIAFSPVEKVLASASGDNTIKLWNITDGTCIKTLEGHEAPVLKLDWLCYGLEIVSSESCVNYIF